MTVVITGGSGAIGSMCAYEAAKQKCDIVLCYNKNKNGADSVVNMLSAFNVKIKTVCADICTKEGTDAIKDAAASLGGADILINNAGISEISAFLDTTEADTEKLLSANLSAHINLTRAILPQMIKKQSGSIVNISSVWGVMGASCEVIYSATKSGLIGFTKALAKELAPSGITVNCVAPGCIESKMLDGLDKESLKDIIPMGRIGDALEVARAVMFLANHGYITGQTLSVDGGMAI